MTNIETHLKELETELNIRGLSKHTIHDYLMWNRMFLEWVKKPPTKIKSADIKSYMAYLMTEKKLANSSVRVGLASIEFYYNEVLLANIPYIKRPKGTHELPVVLTIDEVKKVFAAATNPKQYLMISVMYSSGLRVSEVVNLKYSDLDIKEKIGWVRNGKGNKDRMFILSDDFCQKLNDFTRDEDTDYIFHHRLDKTKPMHPHSVREAVYKIAKKAGINKAIHPHTFRHSFSTHLLDNGLDIRKIQILLGHTNLTTTQRYTQVSNEQIKGIKSPMDTLCGNVLSGDKIDLSLTNSY